MTLNRRTLLGATAATAGLVASGAPLASAVSSDGWTNPGLTTVTDNAKLALPPGFKAKRVSTIGVEPLLGRRGGAVVGRTPSTLDGTGCFDVNGTIRLVRNHECRANAQVTVPLVAGTVYDAGVPGGMGGCTVVETKADGTFVQQWVGLSGTIRNCAGGVTPWGTWLTCEEDTTKAGTAVVSSVDGKTYMTQKDHGYVFEVFPDGNQYPDPILAFGRAVWEGAAIGPDRESVYLTEDTSGGHLYRWTAPAGHKLQGGIGCDLGPNDGKLHAAQLVRNGKALVHFGELGKADVDKPYKVTWISGGEDRQAQKTPLRNQFNGATVHPKIEGCWSDGTGLWFTLSYVNAAEATKYGVDEDQGMVMYYNYATETLTMKFMYHAGDYFDGPDNITVSPWGTLVIAEDGDDPNHLIAWNKTRGTLPLAKDLVARGEWAGPCFTPSGSVLFASIQSDCTYAITGPIKELLTR